MTAPMDMLQSLVKRQTVTHSCPSCSGPVGCDIERGKSSCWCFGLQARELEWGDTCLCRQCLTGDRAAFAALVCVWNPPVPF